MSFKILPHETFLDLDGVSASLASQSLYKSHLKVDSDGGPMNFAVTFFSFLSIFSLTFFFFCMRFDGFSLNPYYAWRGKMTFLPLD